MPISLSTVICALLNAALHPSQQQGAESSGPVVCLVRRHRDEMNFHDEIDLLGHLLPMWQYIQNRIILLP
jgi:hypothetical protein